MNIFSYILFSLLYCFTVVALSQNKQFDKYLALSDSGKVAIVFDMNSVDLAKIWPYVKEDLPQIIARAKKSGNYSLVNQANKLNGNYYYSNKRYNQAIPSLSAAIHDGRGLSLMDSALVLMQLVESYSKIKKFNKAFEYAQIISQIKKRNPNLDPWVVNTSSSTIYLQMGLYEKGIHELREDYNHLPASKYKTDGYTANQYNNIGVYFNRWGKADSAIHNFLLAKKLVVESAQIDTSKIAGRFFLGLIEGNIGQALMLKKEYKKAIPLLKEDIFWSIKSNNKGNAAISLNELGQCYIKLNNYTAAKSALDSSTKLLGTDEDLSTYLYNKKLMADLYAKQGKNGEAIILFADYINTKDSLTTLENDRQLISEQVAFDVQQKEDQIENQVKLLDENQKINQQNIYKTQLLFIVIMFLGVILVLTVYYLQRSKKQQKTLRAMNAEIHQQKSSIEHSLREKEVLIKEVHHRVKNNLQIVSSLISLQVSKSTNEEVKETLNECKQRIFSIALTHQFLYKTDSIVLIQMKEYLIDLVNQLKIIYNLSQVEIEVVYTIADIKMDVDTALPVGLIVNELISNAYKHAFNLGKGTIQLSLSCPNNQYCILEIKDNGIGLSKTVLDNQQFNIGLELVDMLSDQLEAKKNIDVNNGTTFSFVFKPQVKSVTH